MWHRFSQGGVDRDRRKGGKLYHYLQVKPVADALRYTEQKWVQTTQRRYRSRHNDRSNLTEGNIAIRVPNIRTIMMIVQSMTSHFE